MMTIEERFYNTCLMYSSIVVEIVLAITVLIAYKRKKYFNMPLTIFFYYLVAMLGTLLLMSLVTWASSTYQDYWAPILKRLGIDNTNFFAILGYCNTFILLGLYFSKVFPEVRFRAYILPLSWVLLAIASIDYFFVTGYNQYSSFSQTLVGFYILLMPMAHLWYLYRTSNKVPLNRNPYFWISMGLVLPSILSTWLELYGSKLYVANFILFCQVSFCSTFFYCAGQFLITVGFYYARYVQYLPQTI